MRYTPFQELETPRLLLRKLRPEDCMDFYHRLGKVNVALAVIVFFNTFLSMPSFTPAL